MLAWHTVPLFEISTVMWSIYLLIRAQTSITPRNRPHYYTPCVLDITNTVTIVLVRLEGFFYVVTIVTVTTVTVRLGRKHL